MARILIVEDEVDLAEALARGLREERYVVDTCHDGAQALGLIDRCAPDLVLLDLLLPGMDGLEICRRLRRSHADVPVLMLTARDATADVVRGLDSGANDYLTKPFAFEELLARVRAHLRDRVRGSASVLEIADLQIDLAGRTVRRAGVPITLTTKEFQILEYLALNRGRVVSRDSLSQAVWHPGDEPGSNVIEVYISNLRRKVDRGRDVHLIHTIRGAGYSLRAALP